MTVNGAVPSHGPRRVIDLDEERESIRYADKPEQTPPAALTKLGTLLVPALDRAERRRAGLEVPVPIPFAEYADILGGGFWPGAHFLGAGTGVGKSQFTIQTSITAAVRGIPAAYVGLELDEAQIALRTLGAHAGVGWSGLYVGRCSEGAIKRARDAVPAIAGLPFYVDFGPPRGWPASRLYDLATNVRKEHPTGPFLIVLDYLQLVGDEPTTFERRPDLRERIGGAAYAARDVARRFDASIVLVSSAARTHYGLLASDAAEAGLITTRTGYSGPVKTIAHPEVLVGLGKESGELEYAGDSVTVLIKWPAPLENGDRAIVCAVPKLRYGPGRWCALAFGGGSFTELPVESTDDLPDVPKRKRAGGKTLVDEQDFAARVVATLRKLGPTKSRRTIVDMTEGTTSKLYAAIKSCIQNGAIVAAADGTLSASIASAEDGGSKQ